MLCQAHFLGGLGDDGQKLLAQRGAGFFGKELRDRRVAARQDVFGVGHRHAAHGADQQVLAHGHGGFGGAVDRGFQLFDALALAKSLHQLGRVVEVTRQRDAHLGVVQKPARLAQQAHSRQRALL